ncbi:MAG: PUR family DNA/RNA-binding protein [Spirochaetes bacterium]|nr:PUR family DNA/RNA-binding protein [Spirochaetota bacterium]MBU0956054.1 PUR family DNA/RNA-binding protein [Spirochaetota bacterium]
MGVRGEVFSSRVICEGRTYFFNVKENRTGDLFLAIVESKPGENESFDRRSIVVFKDNVQEFLQSFEKALSAMEKAGPSRGRSGTGRQAGTGHTETARSPRREGAPAATGDRKPRVVRRRTDGPGSSGSSRPEAKSGSSTRPTKEGARRMTVRKRSEDEN